MKIITAKFAGTCYQTGKVINAGSKFLYDGRVKVGYHFMSPICALYLAEEKSKDEAFKLAQASQVAPTQQQTEAYIN